MVRDKPEPARTSLCKMNLASAPGYAAGQMPTIERMAVCAVPSEGMGSVGINGAQELTRDLKC